MAAYFLSEETVTELFVKLEILIDCQSAPVFFSGAFFGPLFITAGQEEARNDSSLNARLVRETS